MDKEEQKTPQTIVVKSDDDSTVPVTSAPDQSQATVDLAMPPPAVENTESVKPGDVEKAEDIIAAEKTEDSVNETAKSTDEEVRVMEEEVKSMVAEPTEEAKLAENSTEQVSGNSPTVESEKSATSDQSTVASMPSDSVESATAEPSQTVQSSPNMAMATDQNTNSDSSPVPHENRNNKKLALVVTVVVALILAGAATYVYLSAQDNASEKSSSSNSQSTVAEKKLVEPATVSEIDSSSQSMDEAINSLDDTTDFSDAALSDSALRL